MMTQIVIQVNNDEKAALLTRMLAGLDFVVQIDMQPNDSAEQRARILGYAGSWEDMPEEMWLELQTVLQRRPDFLPERTVSW